MLQAQNREISNILSAKQNAMLSVSLSNMYPYIQWEWNVHV